MPRLVLVEAPPTRQPAAALPASDPMEQLWMFPGEEGGGVDLASLRKERAMLAARTRAANTAKAYRFDWTSFSDWCKRAGRCPLPATSDTLQLYLIAQARAGRALATVARRTAAIAAQHAAAGHASPVDANVREVLAGLGRRLGTAPKHRKAALEPADLVRMVEACPHGALGARDRALLLLGFASSLRRSELAALQLSDVDEVRQGLIVRLGRSKTDQAGVGREIGIHRGARPESCPVRALRGWLAVRGDWAGPLFCHVEWKTGAIARRPMYGESIALRVKAACIRVGLEPAKYSGHSLRAGFATAASANGAAELAIMGRTGHKSVAMLGRYVRHANLFAVDVLAGLL